MGEGKFLFINVVQLTNEEEMKRIRISPFCNPWWNNRSRQWSSMANNFTKRETTKHYVPLDENTKHTYTKHNKNQKLKPESDQGSRSNTILQTIPWTEESQRWTLI